MNGRADYSYPVRLVFPVLVLALGLSLAGCPKPIPRVAIPGSDATPPTMGWQTYNMQTKERSEIVKDGQSLEVPSGEQYVVTLAVEDLNSGVRDVTLSGDVHYTCVQGGQVEDKKFPIETQETKPVLDQESKMPVRASLVYVVEFGKSGCKEKWLFGGGQLSLVGKAHNSVGGAASRTLNFTLKKQPAS